MPAGNLIVGSPSNRGFYGTDPRLHTIDGYDGYRTYDNPFVRFFSGFDDLNIGVQLEENKFDYPNYARTDADGYRVRKDILTTDLSSTDADQEGFPAFDFAGWYRNDPRDILDGKCVGSYFGGEYNCADGYGGIGRRVRGYSVDDVNNMREKVLLQNTGEPVVLVRRLWKGITCSCVNSSRETPEYRCACCFGTGLVTGYEQFYNPRRSDGRILVRFDPAVENFTRNEPGLENEYKPNSWTLSIPSIKDGDFLIRFNKDGTEEFRYEVLDVTRNKIVENNYGRQQLSLTRVRKTDPIYMWRSIRDTSTMPQELMTTLGMVPGPGGIPPHTHTIVINENIVSLVQINQTTSVDQDHNHPIENGVVIPVLGHQHLIIL